MTIAKNTNRARAIIMGAHDIRCFSLSNNFSGEPLVENPVIWNPRSTDTNSERELIHVSQSEFLMKELNSHNAKLTVTDRYVLQIHSNLWYEFR